jgi:hypothetical protein
MSSTIRRTVIGILRHKKRILKCSKQICVFVSVLSLYTDHRNAGHHKVKQSRSDHRKSKLRNSMDHQQQHEQATLTQTSSYKFLFSICNIIIGSFLGSTVQLRPWPPPQNPAEFLGGFSTIFFFTG